MSKVYFVDANAGQTSRVHEECEGKGCEGCGYTGRKFEITPPEPLPLAFGRLLDRVGLKDLINENDRVAIKIHSGEHLNHRLIPPVFYEVLVKRIVELGGKPFLTDTNTVYSLSRYEGIGHYITAWRNGYALYHLGAPFIVADGITGTDATKVIVEGDIIREVYVPSAIYESDVLISVDHTTLHPAFGIGGNVKNLGMGGVAKQTKIQIHKHEIPAFLSDLCRGCGRCVTICPAEAVRIVDGKAIMDTSKCWGCKLCIEVCENRAIVIEQHSPQESFKALADGAMGVLNRFKESFLAVNFLLDITMDCDCPDEQGRPVVPDLGIMASNDIVAIDKASLDMIRSAPIYPLSVVKDIPGTADLTNLSSHTAGFGMDGMLEYLEDKGLGSQKYELVELKRRTAPFAERARFIPEMGYAKRLKERVKKVVKKT
ncbi:MAG TPA: DUF362 domain-containing protein [Candidatus Latescibacteria bacterium]|nr:DUF362 domain-containing protein [Candidatus Latescibacterota bacterium]